MSNDMVEVDKPDDGCHGQRGTVIECLSNNQYVVAFGYSTRIFDGRNLRALIIV
jgi:hypothetical protein